MSTAVAVHRCENTSHSDHIDVTVTDEWDDAILARVLPTGVQVFPYGTDHAPGSNGGVLIEDGDLIDLLTMIRVTVDPSILAVAGLEPLDYAETLTDPIVPCTTD